MDKIVKEMLDDMFCIVLIGDLKEYCESFLSLMFVFILVIVLIYLILVV